MKSSLPSLVNDGFLSGLLDDRFFDSDWMKRMENVPAVNVVETEKEFEVEMAAPGLDKKDFNITVENGILSITCEKETETQKIKRIICGRSITIRALAVRLHFRKTLRLRKLMPVMKTGF